MTIHQLHYPKKQAQKKDSEDFHYPLKAIKKSLASLQMKIRELFLFFWPWSTFVDNQAI